MVIKNIILKVFPVLIAGTFFGIILSKAELVSWYRLQEMFRFHSFHLFGTMFSGIATGMLAVFITKKTLSKESKENLFKKNLSGWKQTLIGGSIFGLGWGLAGSCPGPLYVLLGHGHFIYLLVLVFAVLGALVYGIIRKDLPH